MWQFRDRARQRKRNGLRKCEPDINYTIDGGRLGRLFSGRASFRRQEIEQIAHTATFTIGDRIELLKRLLLTIDPEGRIAEEFGAGGVPAREGRKKDFFAFQAEGIDAHLIGQRVRFVELNIIRTEPVFKKSLKTGAANVGVEHRRCEIVQEREPDTLFL